MIDPFVQTAIRLAIGNRKRVPAAQLREITAAFGAKLCRSCNTVRDVSEFGPHIRTADGLSAMCNTCRQMYRNENKETTNKDRMVRYRANIDIERLRVKEWWLRNKKTARQASKNWRTANPDAQKRAEQYWRLTNPHKHAAMSAKRHAAKRNRTPAWLTTEQLSTIEALYRHASELTCITGFAWHVDHIVPLQGVTVSGLHVPWNLQLLPASENIKKGNRYGGE